MRANAKVSYLRANMVRVPLRFLVSDNTKGCLI